MVQNGKKYGANVIHTLDFVSVTLPPVDRTFRLDTFAPNANPHNAWVNSCPSTYIRVWSGRTCQNIRKTANPERRAMDSAEKKTRELPEDRQIASMKVRHSAQMKGNASTAAKNLANRNMTRLNRQK
jgi:hypothetical protein